MILDQIIKLTRLRELFAEQQIDGYLFFINDEFNNEYVPDHLNRVKFFTGFTGSSGAVFVSQDQAVFFTDSRYYLQAKLELGKYFNILDFTALYYNFTFNGIIGFPQKTTSYNLSTKLKNFSLKPIINLVDLIWENRPNPSFSKVFNYAIKYSGKTVKAKLADIIKLIEIGQFDYIILSNPQAICWLLNIRARDLEYTPILLSYLIINHDGSYQLFANCEQGKSFTEFENYIERTKDSRVMLDPEHASYWLVKQFSKPILSKDPTLLARSIKNSTEIKQAKLVHVADAIALVKFFYWLDFTKDGITEYDLSKKLDFFRELDKKFICPSFASIVGFNSNGAIVHYQPSKNNSKKIESNGVLLIDSGGQYWGGTTDITRVVAIGKQSKKVKIAYTNVLKGHIALARAIFPKKTTGSELDILARYHLWQNLLDYGHGTGHGVGNCLSVHDGVQRISKFSNQELLPGMILSNEPGCYFENEFGIRIENLLLVRELNERFLKFETISLVPLELKLLVKQMLDKAEIVWINQYHQQIRIKIMPQLDINEQKWLLNKTKNLNF